MLTFFAGLGRSAIGDSDEAFYAESAREMIEQGDWITPHYNYDYRFQKPILFYWLVAVSFLSAGIGESAARFPAALAGLGIALVAAACGRRWLGPREGLLGGAIVATSYGYFTIARSSLPDLPLAFFITLATWALLEATDRSALADDRATAPHERTKWLLVGAAATALGVLTKGPVGLVIPALVILAVRIVTGQSLLPSKHGWLDQSWSALAAGAGVLLLIALPWYGAMVGTHGTGYLERFFVGENLERFATDRYNDRRPLWFYVPISSAASRRGRRFSSSGHCRRSACCGGSAGSTPWNGDWSCGPPSRWSSTRCRSVSSRGTSCRSCRRSRSSPPARCASESTRPARTAGATSRSCSRPQEARSCCFVLAFLLYRARPLLFALSPDAGLIGTLVIVAAGVGLAGFAWLGRPSHLPAAIAAAATATLLSLHYSVYSAAGEEAGPTHGAPAA